MAQVVLMLVCASRGIGTIVAEISDVLCAGRRQGAGWIAGFHGEEGGRVGWGRLERGAAWTVSKFQRIFRWKKILAGRRGGGIVAGCVARHVGADAAPASRTSNCGR